MWIFKLIHIVFDKLISHHFKKLLTWVEIDKNIHQNIHDLNRGLSNIMLDNLSNISFDPAIVYTRFPNLWYILIKAKNIKRSDWLFQESRCWDHKKIHVSLLCIV